MLKRILDIFFVIFSVPFLAVLVVPIAIIIKLDSPGPIFLSQIRLGRDKKHFTIYKFRTMVATMDDRASHEASTDMITNVGRFLRKSKLDEIPQLWNVFIGTMSLVGPRPCLPSQHELVALRDAKGVFGVRPGITGLAQLYRVDMSAPDELADFDTYYVKTRTFLGDLVIILKTLLGRGRGDGIGRSVN